MNKKWLWAIGLIGALTACGVSYKPADISSKDQEIEEKGVVALEIVNNTAELHSYITGWQEVVVRRVDNVDSTYKAAVEKAKRRADLSNKPFTERSINWKPEIYTMRPLKSGVSSSQVFVGTMPAGRYIIVRLYASAVHDDYHYSIVKDLRARGGQFEVNAKQVTDLGAVVYQPIRSGVSGSVQYDYVGRLPRYHSLMSYVVAEYPEIASQLKKDSIPGWLPDQQDSLRTGLGQLSRNNPILTTPLISDGRAMGAFAGRLGQVRLYTPKGWEALSLPSNSEINALLQQDDNLLVGTEHGGFYVKKGQGEWQSYHPVQSNEVISALVRSANRYYALTKLEHSSRVYSFTEPSGTWTLLNEFKGTVGSMLDVGNVFLVATPTGATVYSFNRQYLYDEQTATWSDKKSIPFSNFAVIAPGEWLAYGDLNDWATYVTRDYGKTWTDTGAGIDEAIARKGTPITMPVRLGDNYVRFVKESNGEVRVYVSQYNPKYKRLEKKYTWHAKGKVPNNCTQTMLQFSNKEQLFVRCTNGSLMSSTDLGEHWKQEINVDVEQMQIQSKAFEHFFEDLAKEDDMSNSTAEN